MSIATLTFNMTDPDDVRAFNVANKADTLVTVLWDFDQWLRGKIKYEDKAEFEQVRAHLHELLRDNLIDLDNFT